jgi:streptogramin lyase
MTVGPDGNLWFGDRGGTGSGSLDEILAEDGSVRIVTVPGVHPQGMTTGPDGKLWFVDINYACSTCQPVTEKIGKLDTVSGAATEYDIASPSVNQAYGIAAGADGNLWFADGLQIGRVTTAGTFTKFALPPGASHAGEAAAAPNGRVVFTDVSAARTPGGVGKLYEIQVTGGSPGKITEVHLQQTQLITNPSDISLGPDGNLWFTVPESGQIGRLTLH